MLEGEPGIGRSALLEDAAARAAAAGLDVLVARGGDLERELTFGVARQLLEGRLHRADAAERAALLAGAAHHAASLLGVHGAPPTELDEPSLVHALFWVCANLADRGPVCLAVDDAQWADAASLRWLVYLARRLEELPILLVVAVATAELEAPHELLRALAAQPGAQRLALGPLSGEESAAVAREELGERATEAVCAALHEAAGGNPFLVREAAAGLAAAEGAAEAEVPRVRLGPQAAAGFVLRRLERMPPAAGALARAVAVLGSDASLAHAGALAGIAPAEAAAAADQLAAARILGSGRPLAFIHPVVRGTLYHELGPGERSNAHARAARLLHAAGVHPARVVTHLLAAEPAGDPEAVELLRFAAAAESDPRRAAVALRRALAEPPPAEVRGPLLLELGQAEMRAYQPEAIAHLEEGRALSRDRQEWMAATHALARAWTLDARPAAALDWVRAELAALPGEDGETREVRLALRALEVVRGTVEPAQARALEAEAAAATTPAERYLLAALAYKAVDHGSAAEASALAGRALDGGLRSEGIRGTGAILAIGALEAADALDAAEVAARHALAQAREHGDVSGSALALTVTADIACRRGALTAAEADAREALELAEEHGLAWAEPVAIATLVETLAEQGRSDGAEALLAERELTDWQQGSARAALFLHARGRLRMEQERHPEALADFEAAGELLGDYAIDHPAMLNWRTSAAEALLALGRADQARELVDADLARAREFGAAHPVGAALRVTGLLEGGPERLREAVAVLERSPAALARARALVDLGAALRRMGERAASREPLRQGMDLAHRCGASSLAERAQQELAASGARPRRRALTGVDALTPSESRIAELAAGGRSNREIAQALFLSVRTVENQLRSVYAKLEIGSRRELGTALTQS